MVGCDHIRNERPDHVQQYPNEKSETNADSQENSCVEIEVIGVYRVSDIAFVREEIETLIPKAVRRSSWGASSNRFTFEAQYAADVEDLAKKIRFGNSVHVDGHRIRVIYRYDNEMSSHLHKEPTKFNNPPEDLLGPALKRHKGDWVASLKEIRASWQVNKQGEIISLDLPPFTTTDETMFYVAKLTSLKKLDLTMARFVTDEGARHLSSLTNLEVLKLFGSSIGDPGQASLSNLTNLKRLSLSGKGTEFGLRHIARLTHLESLSIGFGIGYPVTTVGLDFLKSMKTMQNLRLDGCEITDDGLRKVVNYFPKLKSLELQDGLMTNVGILHLTELQNLRRLDLSECRKIGDIGISRLVSKTTINSLDLSHTAISDAGIAHLKRLTKLTYLNLSSTQLTDHGVKHLQTLQKLSCLSLAETQITDDGVLLLGPLPRLTQLILDGTAITDASLMHLQLFPKLNNLWLSETDITDEGLKYIGTMKQLNTLQIDGTKITDVGISNLAWLTNLNTLDISNTSVTKNGLQYLTNAKKLYDLRVNDTNITSEDLQSFRYR